MVLSLETWLDSIDLQAGLRPHVHEVMRRLPEPVLIDLLNDPAFIVCDYDATPGLMATIPVNIGVKNPARSIALKRSLARRQEDFVRWVIAHELAHAHLRNQGRWEGDDPEHAADALAADWGFPRPLRGWFVI